jgi:CRP/FNR family transcriptional regulator, cyclic AMP receptor protein
MEDLNFVTRAQTKIYDPAVALAFFKAAGTPESVAQGKSFFVENERTGGMFSRGAKMYFLVDGEVSLTVRNKVIATVDKDAIFGEMATLGQLPRSATAVAKTACRVITLDEKQFRRAIEKSPDFALMLMNIIINRLRETITLLTSSRVLSDDETLGKRSVFEKKVLADLVEEYAGHPPMHVPMHKVIMTEGEAGAFMYVVLEGRVAVSVKNRIVEKIGPGGVFGEMALVDQAPRVGTVTADTDCSLLTINRRDFLLFVKTKPDFSLSLMKALAERLRYMNSQFK